MAFCPSFSLVSGLLDQMQTVVFDRLARSFNRSGANQAVALDVSKTFYRVLDVGLFHKLKSYGISGQALGLKY